MTTLDIQSIVYGNSFADIRKAVTATANAAGYASRNGSILGWTLLLGDCGATPFADDSQLADIRSVVEEAGGSFLYTYFDKNLGSAAGHNALAQLGSADHLIILNPDAQMAYDTLTALVDALSDGTGMVEARQIPIEHPKYYAPRTGLTSWASTACAITPRALFAQLGGFDSVSFFLYCDDVDYSWRVRLSGHRVVYEPAARLFHDKRLTVTADWPASEAEIYYSAEAALMLARKYSRPDLVAAISADYEKNGNEAQKRAAATFAARQAEGGLPAPVDADHKVAEFVSGNYAVHRF